MQTLIDRFKDMRRLCNAHTNDTGKSKERVVVKQKNPGSHNPLALPDVPEGEDSVSFVRNNCVLISEWKKANRNAMVINDLMDRTFAMRRREIIEMS